MAGFALGVTFLLIHHVFIPIRCTSVNPARSFGPAISNGGNIFSQLWLFFVAPVFGAIIAVLICKYGRKRG